MFSIQRFWLILGFSFLTLPGVFANEVRAQTLEVVSLDPVAETSQSASEENAAEQVWVELLAASEESAADSILAHRPSSGEQSTGQIFADFSQLEPMGGMATESAPSLKSQHAPYGSVQIPVADSSAFAFSEPFRAGYLLPTKNFPEEERDRFSEFLATLVPDNQSGRLATSDASEPGNLLSQTPEAETSGEETEINRIAPQTPEGVIARQQPEADPAIAPILEGGTAGQEPGTPAPHEQTATAPNSDRPTDSGSMPTAPLPDPNALTPFADYDGLPEAISVPESSASLFAWLGLAAAGLISTRVRSGR